jgi:hypothetical protein
MNDKAYDEYEFPVRVGQIDKTLTDLDPWLVKFLDMQSEEVAKALRLDWEGIHCPAVISFRNALLSFKPASLVHCNAKPGGCIESGWWLRLKGPPNYHAWDTEVFLHAPPDPSALDESIGHRDYPERDVLVEFCSYFYNMQNSMVGSASGFFPPPWAKLAESVFYQNFTDPYHMDPERNWEQACFLYCTDTGECVLLSPDRRVGWYLSAEQRIRLMAPTFSEFLEQCAFGYRIYGTLDYYNAWETSPYAAHWT